MRKHKTEVITFKIDETLLEAMKGIPNRSRFIRDALSAALDSTCPLCSGTGLLTPKQKVHWDSFAVDHPLKECSQCHELHPICDKKKTKARKNKC